RRVDEPGLSGGCPPCAGAWSDSGADGGAAVALQRGGRLATVAHPCLSGVLHLPVRSEGVSFLAVFRPKAIGPQELLPWIGAALRLVFASGSGCEECNVRRPTHFQRFQLSTRELGLFQPPAQSDKRRPICAPCWRDTQATFGALPFWPRRSCGPWSCSWTPATAAFLPASEPTTPTFRM